MNEKSEATILELVAEYRNSIIDQQKQICELEKSLSELRKEKSSLESDRGYWKDRHDSVDCQATKTIGELREMNTDLRQEKEHYQNLAAEYKSAASTCNAYQEGRQKGYAEAIGAAHDAILKILK